MEQLTAAQKLCLVKNYYTRGETVAGALRAFHSEFRERGGISDSTLRRCLLRFLEHGEFVDLRHANTGRPVTVSTEENIERVRQHFEANPNDTLRKAAQALNINRESVRLILKCFLDLHPYRISTAHAITPNAMATRVQFAKSVFQGIETGVFDPNRIIFSDEAHFYLEGYVNKQNYRFWGSENPHMVISKPLHPQKVTAWAAIWHGGVFLEFFSETVNGERYRELLVQKFFPFAIRNNLVENFYFMQDGAAPHRTKDVFEAIYSVYGQRVVGLGYPKFARGGLEWPPYSPDLTPCDFFLWGYLKDRVFEEKPKDTNELKKAIVKCAKSIEEGVFERVFSSFLKRLEFVTYSDGGHIENVYH